MSNNRTVTAVGTLLIALATVCGYTYGIAVLWTLQMSSAARITGAAATLIIDIPVFAISWQAITTATYWLTKRKEDEPTSGPSS